MLASAVMNAQDQKRVAVVLTNGNEYIGTIQSDDGREVLLLTDKMGKVSQWRSIHHALYLHYKRSRD